jgi:hypothetical protein
MISKHKYRCIGLAAVLMALLLAACGEFQPRYSPYSPKNDSTPTERGGGEGGGNSM